MVRQRQIEKCSIRSLPSRQVPLPWPTSLLPIKNYRGIRTVKAQIRTQRGRNESLLIPPLLKYCLSLAQRPKQSIPRCHPQSYSFPVTVRIDFMAPYCQLFFSAHNTSPLYRFHTLCLEEGEQEHEGNIPHQANQARLS